MKVMFMGTPDIAVPCLERLIKEYDVVCVVTQPDKPKNRGYKLAFSPVKEIALSHNIDVVQPTTFKDEAFLPILNKYKPDVIVVIAYGRILPEYVLKYPRYGCVNVHASLLPAYRGAAPIQWSIVNGEKLTGITTMKMDIGMDTGDMLLKDEIEITDTMTGGELYDIISQRCPDILIKTLENISTIIPQKQDDSLSSYAPMIDKQTATIDWNKTNTEIVNLIRGMNPFPVARTTLDGRMIKIYSAQPYDKNGEPGKIISVSDGIIVGCKSGSVRITELQPEGKRRMTAKDFMLGNKIEVGATLI